MNVLRIEVEIKTNSRANRAGCDFFRGCDVFVMLFALSKKDYFQRRKLFLFIITFFTHGNSLSWFMIAIFGVNCRVEVEGGASGTFGS
jgi:hypothetical protein